MLQVRDQLSRTVTLKHLPKRIISLVPSQTELLFYLKLDDRIVGLTRFCIHPAKKVQGKIRIGGTKQLDIPQIRSLDPDLIIANKEENVREQIDQLAEEYPVYVSDPYDLSSALQMIKDIGVLTGREFAANRLTNTIDSKFCMITALSPPVKTLYMIWRKPYMAAGKGTFIDDMLMRCGFENVMTQERYPQLSVDEIRMLRPELILLSSEPYPFAQKHVDELSPLMLNAMIKLVDGEMFSWYGSRLLKSADHFISLTDRLKRS